MHPKGSIGKMVMKLLSQGTIKVTGASTGPAVPEGPHARLKGEGVAANPVQPERWHSPRHFFKGVTL